MMLRGIWTRINLVVATTVFALPLSLVLPFRPELGNATWRAGRKWSRWMLRVVGARLEYRDLRHALDHSPCIYIANHQSSIDIWVLLNALPETTRFVAKAELFRIPVFGWVLSGAGYIPIDRRNRAEAIRSLKTAADRIRDGISVILFPEGTRSRDGRLRPFKKGAFHLALQAGVPIIPIAIQGSHAVMPTGRLRVDPGPVTVRCGEPLDPTPFQPGDHNGLMHAVHERIADLLRDPQPDGVEA